MKEMKTKASLEAKWWYRLTKAFYILFTIVAFALLLIAVYSFYTYYRSPKIFLTQTQQELLISCRIVTQVNSSGEVSQWNTFGTSELGGCIRGASEDQQSLSQYSDYEIGERTLERLPELRSIQNTDPVDQAIWLKVLVIGFPLLAFLIWGTKEMFFYVLLGKRPKS